MMVWALQNLCKLTERVPVFVIASTLSMSMFNRIQIQELNDGC